MRDTKNSRSEPKNGRKLVKTAKCHLTRGFAQSGQKPKNFPKKTFYILFFHKFLSKKIMGKWPFRGLTRTNGGPKTFQIWPCGHFFENFWPLLLRVSLEFPENSQVFLRFLSKWPNLKPIGQFCDHRFSPKFCNERPLIERLLSPQSLQNCPINLRI